MTSPVGATQIIAHRGASRDAPENTLAAFKLGYLQLADANELDIRLTKDGRIVVIHDFDTRRTGGIPRKVVDQTLEQLRRQDVGRWGRWRREGFSEKIPLLDEVLALVPGGCRLFLEIKCGPEILPELHSVLQRSDNRPEQTVLIGFGYETMKAAKEKLPGCEVNLLATWRKLTRKFPPVGELIEKAKAAKLDGLDLNSGFPIGRELVAKVHKAGLKLYTWTVDDPRIARREADAGVDGITTNRPGWLRQHLGARA